MDSSPNQENKNFQGPIIFHTPSDEENDDDEGNETSGPSVNITVNAKSENKNQLGVSLDLSGLEKLCGILEKHNRNDPPILANSINLQALLGGLIKTGPNNEVHLHVHLKNVTCTHGHMPSQPQHTEDAKDAYSSMLDSQPTLTLFGQSQIPLETSNSGAELPDEVSDLIKAEPVAGIENRNDDNDFIGDEYSDNGEVTVIELQDVQGQDAEGFLNAANTEMTLDALDQYMATFNMKQVEPVKPGSNHNPVRVQPPATDTDIPPRAAAYTEWKAKQTKLKEKAIAAEQAALKKKQGLNKKGKRKVKRRASKTLLASLANIQATRAQNKKNRGQLGVSTAFSGRVAKSKDKKSNSQHKKKITTRTPTTATTTEIEEEKVEIPTKLPLPKRPKLIKDDIQSGTSNSKLELRSSLQSKTLDLEVSSSNSNSSYIGRKMASSELNQNNIMGALDKEFVRTEGKLPFIFLSSNITNQNKESGKSKTNTNHDTQTQVASEAQKESKVKKQKIMQNIESGSQNPRLSTSSTGTSTTEKATKKVSLPLKSKSRDCRSKKLSIKRRQSKSSKKNSLDLAATLKKRKRPFRKINLEYYEMYIESTNPITQKAQWKCKKCGEVFQLMATIQRKLGLHHQFHKDPRRFTCNFCYMVFEDISSNDRHMKVTHGYRKDKTQRKSGDVSSKKTKKVKFSNGMVGISSSSESENESKMEDEETEETE